ncbi:MAG: class II aldolase/adducin family protein [Chloroflexota bacterium]
MSANANRQKAREDVVLYSHRMQREHLTYWTGGNISCRVAGEPNLFAVTPTSTPYDILTPDDIAIATIDGEIVEGAKKPTSEFPLHTLMYQRRPEVGGIVHTHSVGAMSMAVMGWTLPPILTGWVEATGGEVVTAPYARPGSPELADAVATALEDRGACFLRHHGLLAIGADLHHAYQAASVTEGAAQVYLRLRQDGPVPELPASEVEWIAGDWRSQFHKG